MCRLLLLLAVPALANAYSTITIYGDVSADKDFFQWTYPWLIDNLSGKINVEYKLLGSGRHSVPQMCALEQLRGNAFLEADYLSCESRGLPAQTCLCRNGIDPEIHKQCVLYGSYRADTASHVHHELKINKSPIIDTHKGLIYDLYDTDLLKALCSLYLEEYNKPIGCLTLKGNGNTTMSSFDRNNPVNFSCK